MRYLPELDVSEYAWMRGLEEVERRIRGYFKEDESIEFVAIQPYDSERNVECLTFVGTQYGVERIMTEVPIATELLDQGNPELIDDVLPFARESALHAIANGSPVTGKRIVENLRYLNEEAFRSDGS